MGSGVFFSFFLKNAYSKVYSTVLHLYIHTRFHFFFFFFKLYHFRRNRLLKWSHMTNILKCLHILYWEIVNFFSFCLLFRKPKYCCFYAKTLVLKRLSEHMLTHALWRSVIERERTVVADVAEKPLLFHCYMTVSMLFLSGENII